MIRLNRCIGNVDSVMMRFMMPWLRKKRVWIPLSLVALYILFGFFAAGPILRSQLEKKLPKILKRDVKIDSIAINPLALSIRARQFAVTEKDGSQLVAFDELYINVAGIDLIRGIIGFNEISLTRPIIGIAFLKDGRLNVADLLESDAAQAPAPQPVQKKKPRIVRITHFGLTDGAVRFADLSRPTPYRAELKPLTLNVVDFTTETGQEGSPYSFNARLGPTSLGWNGDFVANPLHSKGELVVQGLDLVSFNPYLEGNTRVHLEDGSATITSRYALDATPQGIDFVLEQTAVTIAGLVVSLPKDTKPLLTVGTFEVRANRIDVPKQTVALDVVRLTDGSMTIRRLANGTIEVAELSSPKASVEEAPPSSPVAEPAVASAPEARPSPWHVSLPRLGMERFSVLWEDQALQTPAKVPADDVSVEVRDFELPFGKPFTVQVSANVAGAPFQASGPMTLQPFSTTLTTSAKALSLPLFWPYVAEALDGSLTAGTVDATGVVTIAKEGLSVTADAVLSGCALDDAAGASLVTFDKLDVEGLRFQVNAGSLEMAALALTKARGRIEIDAQGQMNLSRLVKPTPPPVKPAAAPDSKPDQPVVASETKTEQATANAPESKPAQPDTPFSLKLGTLRLDNLRVDLLDRSVKPVSALSLQRLVGRVQNISTPKLAGMRIGLTALVDGAPLAINGTLKPAGKDTRADLTLTLGGYNLPLASSYAIKYVAQPIQKGKLSLDMKWKVENRQLDGQNRLRADQLEFGDRVDTPGPDATKLPLGLAVAILSDRSGLIDLDLPVSGDLADPKFGWFSVVITALKNILVKVATAPFSLLAGLISGDPQDLKSVAFVPGEAAPETAEQAKIDNLRKVLFERPALRVEMTPGVDPNADRLALARIALKKQLAHNQNPQAGAPTDGVGQVDTATWEAWVRKTWLAGQGSKDAPVADVPFAQIEQSVLTAHAVSDDELEALRRERALWVQSALTADGKVSSERIFITADPDALTSTKSAVTIDLK